jgi:glyceraldehyde 3-phosphate dehydrogenase
MQVAINGLGRVGRQVLRQIQQAPGLEIVAVNDLAEPAGIAQLIKHDSLHGRAAFTVGHGEDHLLLDGRRVPLFREEAPDRLPFGRLGAQVVLECTGRAASRERASAHLRDGVRRVLIAAPVPGEATVLPGLSEDLLGPGGPVILSAACATSHALGILLQVLDAAFGVTGGLATAVESLGNDQRILDLPHPDLRLARAAAMSMIPAPSGAAACVTQALPALAGLLEVQAIRVPTPDVSLADLSVTLEREATEASVLQAFDQAARGPLRGRLELLDEQLVSVDLRGSSASCLLDPFLTRIMSPRFVKVFGWYDNEVAYAARLKDFCIRLKGEQP